MNKDELLALGVEESVADKIVEEETVMQSEYEARIEKVKLESEIESMLTRSGARNIKAVRALLTSEDIDGVKGEIEALKKDEETKFLFEARKSFSPARSSERLPDTEKNDYEIRLAEARGRGDTVAAIRIKQQAANAGIILS